VNRLILDLAHGFTAPESETRHRSADEVTDVHRSLSADDIAVLVHVLVAARITEPERGCQEAQLHALAELQEWHELPLQAIARLRFLEAPSDDPSQIEYLESLLRDEGA
jgi:hypothetical protein